MARSDCVELMTVKTPVQYPILLPALSAIAAEPGEKKKGSESLMWRFNTIPRPCRSLIKSRLHY